ncbi:MAG: FAD-dependent oxidoreductase, partial [Simkaniaceae bacterium]|nr:FAD-dependent oxidoreductase [Simkaniaceae bacterium]
MRTINFDVIILGSGIAGCTAAYHLAKEGKNVALVSSSANVWGINSARAQGGIVSEDGDGMLVSDILAAGDGKNDRAVVEELVKLGPPLVTSFLLEELKIPFDERRTKEAAHSCSRILFSNDQTGLAIMERLLQAVSLKKEITFVTKRRGVELFMQDGECLGLYVLGDEGTTLFTAQATVLATGGVGDLYAHTSNSKEAKGDGIALAADAGAELADLHYVQFHPTSFYKPGSRSFLLTEALRGEGGVLLNEKGEEFCDSLAPRDEVTRAIFTEIAKGSLPHVWLDVRHLAGKYLQERF